jgi:hypothetical protein
MITFFFYGHTKPFRPRVGVDSESVYFAYEIFQLSPLTLALEPHVSHIITTKEEFNNT